MRYEVRYTRLEFLTELIDADSPEEVERIAQERKQGLQSSDFNSAVIRHSIEPLSIKLYCRVMVIAEGNLQGATGVVVRCLDMSGNYNGHDKALVDFGTVRETFAYDELEVLSYT